MSTGDSSHKQSIDAISVRPTVASTEVRTFAASQSQSAWVWGLLLLLCIVALLVFFLLPRVVEKVPVVTQAERVQPSVTDTAVTLGKSPEPSPAVTTTPESAVDIDSDENLAARTVAEQRLSQIIELERDLEQHAVNLWAAEAYAEANAISRQGDELLRLKDYIGASDIYRTVIEQLSALHQQIEPLLAQALERGQQALLEGDRITATQQFQRAQAIDMDNLQARQGLQRAETIEQLFAQLQQGSRFESHNQLHQARDTYEAALTLDPLATEAQSALNRVQTKLQQQEYDRLLAEAYRALQNGQYAQARNHFNAARKLRPDAAEPARGLAQLEQAVRQEKINALLFEAQHFHAQQQWQQAVEAYEKLLQLDKNHAIANAQLEVARRNAQLLVDVRQALSEKEQLFRDDVLQRAEQVLSMIAASVDTGSIIAEYAQELQETVRIATTPVPIILESDEHTEVVVYKVARLGSFLRHELQLRPGPYTVVGSRPGYRDVRKSFTVTPTDKFQTLVVRCEEPI